MKHSSYCIWLLMIVTAYYNFLFSIQNTVAFIMYELITSWNKGKTRLFQGVFSFIIYKIINQTDLKLVSELRLRFSLLYSYVILKTNNKEELLYDRS